MNIDLTEDNFTLFAIKHYDNPACRGIDEFNDDLKRLKYVKRLFNKYSENNELKERLILNHLVVLYNLFGVEAATKMLFLRIERRFWSQLKTFLVFLNCMPVGPIRVNGEVINGFEIPLDEKVAEILGNI